MKVTQMPPVHAADLVVNSGYTAYGVEVIDGYLFLLLFNSNRAWLWHQPLVVRQEFSCISLIEYDMIFLLLLFVPATSRRGRSQLYGWRRWVHFYGVPLWGAIIFSCDQAALWMVFSVPIWRRQERRSKYAVQLASWQLRSNSPKMSVRPSVCPSVTPFWLCSHHRIIMKFSGVITLDQGKVHAKGQGQRSKVKVTEFTTQIFVSGL